MFFSKNFENISVTAILKMISVNASKMVLAAKSRTIEKFQKDLQNKNCDSAFRPQKFIL